MHGPIQSKDMMSRWRFVCMKGVCVPFCWCCCSAACCGRRAAVVVSIVNRVQHPVLSRSGSWRIQSTVDGRRRSRLVECHDASWGGLPERRGNGKTGRWDGEEKWMTISRAGEGTYGGARDHPRGATTFYFGLRPCTAPGNGGALTDCRTHS